MEPEHQAVPMTDGIAMAESKSESSSVEFFTSWDFDFVVACLPPMGYGGMFRLRDGSAPRVWELLPPNSPVWDSVHQNLYSQYRGERITDPGQLAALPPIPPVPDESRVVLPTRESYYLPAQPLEAAHFPQFCAELSRRQTSQATLKVTLAEDGYETSFGDGKFLYLHNAVLHPEDAPEFVDHEQEAAQRGWDKYYTRYLLVRQINGQTEAQSAILDFPSFHLGMFEHYRPAEALKKCDDNLSASAGSALPALTCEASQMRTMAAPT